SEKKEVQTVITNYNKFGETYMVHLEIIPVFDEQGNHTNFIALQRDITSEMRHEALMLSMNTRFQMIAQNSKTGIWEWRVADNRVEWNDYMYQIYGVDESRSADLRKIWQESIHESDRGLILQNTADLVEGRQNFVTDEYEIIRQSDGQHRILKSITIAERNSQDQLLRLVGSSQDITEERALIAERDASMQRVNTMRIFYESILNHSPEHIVVLNAAGEVIFQNHAAHISSAWLGEGFAGSIFEHQTADDRFNRIITGIRSAIKQQKWIQLSDDSSAETEAQYLYNVLPYANDSGALEHIIVSTIDISELKRVQLSLERKNEELKKINLELDHFVYSVSHDLRSPLLSIKGIISLILSGSEIDHKTKHLLSLADTSASRLDNTIQEILEYSRNSRLQVEYHWMQLRDALQSIYDDMRFSISDEIEFQLNISAEERIWTDGARLNIVLKNIIGNSIKYRRAGVKPIIECS
ncbi:MAG: PAS domain S-box protein, partial [Flavobacteriales bacterium]